MLTKIHPIALAKRPEQKRPCVSINLMGGVVTSAHWASIATVLKTERLPFSRLAPSRKTALARLNQRTLRSKLQPPIQMKTPRKPKDVSGEQLQSFEHRQKVEHVVLTGNCHKRLESMTTKKRTNDRRHELIVSSTTTERTLTNDI